MIKLRPALFIGSLVFLFCDYTFCQKILQYEKGASLKTTRFYIGDEITFKLTDSDIWYTRILYDMDLEKNTITIDNSVDDIPIAIPLSDITHIRIRGRRKVLGVIGTALFVGGINTVLSSLFLARRGTIPSLSEDAAPIYYGAGGSAVGYGLIKLSRKSGVKLNDRKRLRLLDITPFYPVP